MKSPCVAVCCSPNHLFFGQVMNEWYYSNADPADATQEVSNGGARLPVRDAQGFQLRSNFLGFFAGQINKNCWKIYENL